VIPVLSISWSALRGHEECRMRGKLLKAGKKNPQQDIRGYFPGTVVDRAMRYWLDDPDLPDGGMLASVDQIMADEEQKAKIDGDGVVRWRNKNDRLEVAQFCRELVIRLEPILRELVTPFDYQPAMRFRTPVTIPYLDGTPTEVNLTGEMDVLVRAEGQWGVWDLKGTKDDSYWRKTLGQLTFYDVATNALFGQHSARAGLIQPMCKERVKEVSITDEDRRVLMSRVVRMAHDLWKENYTLAADPAGCFRCPVKHACPKFDSPFAGVRLSVARMRDLVADPVLEP